MAASGGAGWHCHWRKVLRGRGPESAHSPPPSRSTPKPSTLYLSGRRCAALRCETDGPGQAGLWAGPLGGRCGGCCPCCGPSSGPRCSAPRCVGAPASDTPFTGTPATPGSRAGPGLRASGPPRSLGARCIGSCVGSPAGRALGLLCLSLRGRGERSGGPPSPPHASRTRVGAPEPGEGVSGSAR